MRKVYLPEETRDFRYFWDKNWSKCSLEAAINEVETNFMKPIFSKYFPAQGKILEAGCGLGKYVIYYRKKGYQIEGVDFAKEAINRIKAYDPDFPVRVEDLRNLSYPDEYFQLYYSGGVLEHFEDGPRIVLGEAYRILKKDGILIVTVPYLNYMRRIEDLLIFKILRKKSRVKNPRDSSSFMYRLTCTCKKETDIPEKWRFYQYVFSKSEIWKLLEDSGFSPVFSKPVQVCLPIGKISLVKNMFENDSGRKRRNFFREFIKRYVLCEDGTSLLGNIVVNMLGVFIAHQIAIVCKKAESKK